MYAARLTQLPPEALVQWSEWLAACRSEAGPLLHPTYVSAVDAVRDDVEVGVLEEAGETIGFLPFQRGRLGIARPLGGRLCDLSGAVVRPGATWDARAFVRGAGLQAIRMQNAPMSDPALRPFQDRPLTARRIDLPDGFEAYREERRASGSKLMRQLDQRRRKAEREIGDMRFVWHTDDDAVFDQLMRWKADQRQETRTPNVLDLQWAKDLLARLRATRTPEFEGLLSAVYFGDTLAAAHFGVRAGAVLHYWIPAYGDDLQKYSPGLICLMEVARAASERGVLRIDLGVGEQRFKQRAGTGTHEVATATVSVGGAVRAALSTADGVRAWARGSSASGVIQRTRRIVVRGSYLARSLLG